MPLNRIKKWGIIAYWLFALLYWEVLVHGSMYGQFLSSFRFALGFTAAIALAIGVLVSLLPRRAVFPVSLILSLLITLVYGSQMVYCFIFKTPYSVSQMGMGADAVTSFWREMLGGMADNIPWLLGMVIPYIGLILLKKGDALKKPGWKIQLGMIVLAVALTLGTYAGIRSGGTARYSDYYFFTSTKSTTTQTMERFGVPMTFYLELTHTEEAEEEEEAALVVVPTPTLPTETEGIEEEVEIPTVYNVLDVDFEALNQKTEDARLITLNDYFAQLTGTSQNDYTGMLADYNLIEICAESFSPAAVDPVITPTLYKLTQEGFLFNNYYNSFPNTTIDGEYALMQGLYPDASRGKDNSSMLASAKHTLPFTLGNIFAEQRGVHSFGYHNNYGSFYNRAESHPNLGYEMKFNNGGFDITTVWPASDLEMMEATVDDYIHQPQFHAYYMTFSGHYLYKTSQNAMAAKNYPLVKDLSQYNMEQKSYLACHIELDKALEYLLQRLEEEGIADKTAIVIASDHFPYGLMKKQYFEMIGQEEDYFASYKSNLIFWVGGLEEPIEVDTYCCNVDVLPTILNLWGFQYDSRMLAGTDVFSDGLHAAVLIDRSFLTDQVWFNSNSGEIRYQAEESNVSPDYIDTMNALIAARFDLSKEILRNDYYGFAFGE